MMERPEIVTDEHLEYLDELRDSGDTNMSGAGVCLDAEFPELLDARGLGAHSSSKAREIVAYWMQSFTERHPPETEKP